MCDDVQSRPGRGGGLGGQPAYTEAGPAWMCVSTLEGNGLVIYGHGLRGKKDKPVFGNDKVITFLLFFQ